MLTIQQISDLRSLMQQSNIIQKAWLFGSVARDEQKPDSDIDIMYEKIPGTRFGLLALCSLAVQMEDLLHRKVDFVDLSSVKKEVLNDSLKDRIQVYERL